MKKWMMALCALALLGSCKDEFNLPEYDSTIDGDGPTIEVTSPAENGSYHGTATVPIDITFKDNYFLSSFNIEIAKADALEQDFVYSQKTNDSVFRYQGTYTLPTADTGSYRVILTVTDSVGYETLDTYLFTASN